MTTAQPAAVRAIKHDNRNFITLDLCRYLESPPARRVEISREYKPMVAMERAAMHVVNAKTYCEKYS